MFDALANRLQDAMGDLGRRSRLDEETVTRATREIRLALLEADVDFEVVKDFVASVRERALGQDVLKGLEPGQQVVKIVHEELTELMGSADSKLAFGRPPTVVLLCGLQGSGKTTAAAKLALHLRKHEKKTPGLVAADLQRPAAIDQLEQLGRQLQVPVYRTDTTDAVVASREGLERATADGCDVVIVDTAGRLQIDEALMEELAHVRDAVKAAQRAARARCDDRSGGSVGRARVPGSDRLRRRRADEARRRRARRRCALGQGDHRSAREVRVGR
jgi:signal recognition particle subunit SRP54